jgi:hypothetical protein
MMGVEILVPDSSIDSASGNEDLSVHTSARKANLIQRKPKIKSLVRNWRR